MSNTSKVTLTFFLKVDPSEVKKLFKQGYFKEEKKKTKISQNENSIPSFITEGSNSLDQSYILSQNYARTIIINTKDHEKFQNYIKNGEIPKGGRCQWYRCMKDFDHQLIGYPIKIDYNLGIDNDNIKIKKCIFHIEGCFCSYEHAYLFLINFNNQVNQAVSNLLFMYNYIHGKDLEIDKIADVISPVRIIVPDNYINLNNKENYCLVPTKETEVKIYKN